MINYLSIARQKANLTQQQVCDKLAEKLGKMSIVTVRNMEDTETEKKVSHGSIIAYCQLLGLEMIEVPQIVSKLSAHESFSCL